MSSLNTWLLDKLFPLPRGCLFPSPPLLKELLLILQAPALIALPLGSLFFFFSLYKFIQRQNHCQYAEIISSSKLTLL